MPDRYRTIVADPPWDHSDGTGVNMHGGRSEAGGLSYPTMTLDAIKALPVQAMAQSDVAGNRSDKTIPRDGSTLYLWTTTRYLYEAHDVVRAWGFNPTTVLVWCKPPRGFGMGGTFMSNVEFVIVGRRGSPPRAKDSSDTRWFEWPRGEHSAKPEAFLDLVERISVGPYLELFARRDRLGWDTWGDESLGTAEMAA